MFLNFFSVYYAYIASLGHAGSKDKPETFPEYS